MKNLNLLIIMALLVPKRKYPKKSFWLNNFFRFFIVCKFLIFEQMLESKILFLDFRSKVGKLLTNKSAKPFHQQLQYLFYLRWTHCQILKFLRGRVACLVRTKITQSFEIEIMCFSFSYLHLDLSLVLLKVNIYLNIKK
jgi:hypothetical protein